MRCDAKKFAQMYESIYRDLYRYALCVMRHAQDAEDAVSEAVLSAYEHIGGLRSEEAFKSWMFTILANVCRKKLKKAALARDAEGLREESRWESREEIPGPEPDYGLAVDVRDAFFVLSQEEQEIVAMSVFGGYNSREIGGMLGLNANTVRSKRSRALEKMACVLK